LSGAVATQLGQYELDAESGVPDQPLSLGSRPRRSAHIARIGRIARVEASELLLGSSGNGIRNVYRIVCIRQERLAGIASSTRVSAPAREQERATLPRIRGYGAPPA
jgi:glucokinase